MPELKARAHTLNELADGARFLFAERPLALDDGAAALLTAEARALARIAHMPRLPHLRSGTQAR